MKNTTTFLFLFFAICKLHSQDYTLSFTGSIESTLVDSVYVENLTQGTFISIPNGFNLHLLKTINGVDEIHKASNQELTVTNNGQNNSITIEFEATANAQTNVELHDLSGKMQARHQIFLNKGKHCFDIDGLNSGLFIITVRSKEFYYSGKASISAPASSEIKIFNHRHITIVR